MQLSPGRRPPSLPELLRVPEGRYLVLGDHRNNSSDSRDWGLVEAPRVMGRVTHIAVSFSSRHAGVERFARPIR